MTKRIAQQSDDHIPYLSASRFLDEPGNPIYLRLTIWGIVVAIGTFVAWASVTPVYEVVTGTGQIRPAGSVRQAEHLEGGIVAKVHVEEGDTVVAGDPLVELDPTAIRAELEKTLTETASVVSQLARAEAFLADDRSVLDEVDFAAAAEWAFQLAQIEVFRADRAILEAEVNALEARDTKAQEEMTILDQREQRLARLTEDGLAVTSDLENVRRERVRLVGEQRQTVGERAVREASIARSYAQEAELLASLRRDAALEAEALRDRLAVLNQTKAQLEDRLDRLVITAPAAGIVQALTVSNAGQVVAQGDVVAEVVPTDAAVYAEIDVSADKINGVSPGRPASLKVLTHDFTRFGVVDARVDRVSPTSVTLPDGTQAFRVRLSFDEGDAPLSDAGSRPITPGMTVTADIRTDRRTVLNYLLKPVRVIADRAMSEG